jgi:multidrug resistance efflux pump
MKSKNLIRNIIIAILVLAAGGYAVWYYAIRPNALANSELSASGTVESTEINVVPQQAGKVVKVSANEGDEVKTGDVLFQLDDTLLNAQRSVSEAALTSAKAANDIAQIAVAEAQNQYDTAVYNALNADKTGRIQDWKKNKPGEFDQAYWYFDKTEQVKAAQAELDQATTDLKKAQDNLTFVTQKTAGADFLAIETRLADARVAFENAKDVLDRAANANNGSDLKDEAQDTYDNAKTELNHAQDAYDQALTSQGADDILQARAKVEVARERVDSINDRLRAFETGLDSPAVKAAQLALDHAKASATQSSSSMQQAQANLDLIDTQLGLNVIKAPVDGIVLTRNAEIGSVFNTAGVMMTLGTTSDLTITVYVPEDRIGEVILGQTADVHVDSFPGKTFKATVSYIADQAEFTPRNVQTVDGRKTTVFAVKLKLEDTAGKLKPGMPADVVFTK